MNLRKRCLAWVLAALCAPGWVLANDEEEPKPVSAEGVLLRGVPQEGPQADPETPTRTLTIVSDETPDPTGVRLILDGQIQKRLAEVESQGKFWIGLMCTAPSDALRTQLDLASDVGLLVDEVYDDGPAKKAGLQLHDVLVSATVVGQDEVRSLKNLTDLVNAVQAAETTAMKLELLRRGRKQVLEVVPGERPKTSAQRLSVRIADPNQRGAWSSTEAVGLRWAGPMIVNLKTEPLPAGMTMEFQPVGAEPRKVIVKKGDQVWTTEVDSLDKLPDEIRALVKQQLQLRNSHVATRFAHGATTSGNVSFVAHAIAPMLPDDVTITTVRKGSAPAKVTLQKGDQTWDVTDKDLATIPADLRPLAAMALHGHLTGPAPFTKIMALPAPPVIREMHVVEPRSAKVAVPTTTTSRQATATAKIIDRTQNQRDIERQLKELSEQVEKLRQAVEKTPPKQ